MGGKSRRTDWRPATVKRFDESLGYGFVIEPQAPKDVYLHRNVLKSCGVSLALSEGQQVHVRWREGPKGPIVASIKLA